MRAWWIPLLAACVSVANSAQPNRDGLVMWLDASAAESRQEAEGNLTGWRDLVGGKQATIRGQVKIVEKAMNGLDVLRFGDEDKLGACDFPAWHDAESPITLFLVWRRTKEQASERKWQRLVACANADRTKGFNIAGAMRGSGEAVEPVLYTVSHVTAAPLPLTVGLSNAPFKRQQLRGDIAELLVYNRRFEEPDEFHAVEDYLLAKWGCRPDPGSQGWLRPSNVLPEVAHTRTDLPLHDQANAGKWEVYEPWTDEFDAGKLDDTRWWDHNPAWHGRAPSRYLPRNVTVTEEGLGITMSMDAPKEHLILYGEGSPPYHTYAAASVVSKEARTYGGFEIRARAMASYATSAWWFTGRAKNEKGEIYSNEIDVFEVGDIPHEQNRMGGNLHVERAPGIDHHPPNPAGWLATFRLAEDFHVYGADWGPKYIRWYIDGVCFRSVRNTHWHTPLRMLFDTEIWSWWPDPIPEHFPSTFHIDYVRSWSRADWPEPTDVTSMPMGKKITNLLEAAR